MNFWNFGETHYFARFWLGKGRKMRKSSNFSNFSQNSEPTIPCKYQWIFEKNEKNLKHVWKGEKVTMFSNLSQKSGETTLAGSKPTIPFKYQWISGKKMFFEFWRKPLFFKVLARKRKKSTICFPEIWGSSPGRLQTHQTTIRDPESRHISRNDQNISKKKSDPESNQYWGIRKHQKIIQK